MADFRRVAARYGYLPLCFLSLFGSARWFYWMYAADRRWGAIPLLLDLGWSLLLTAAAAALPRRGKRIYLGLLGAVLFLLTLVHGIYVNMFRRFFSFSDLAYAGDGFAFLDSSYLMVRKLAVLLGLLCLALMVGAILLAPREEAPRSRLICSLACLVPGLGLVLGVWGAELRGDSTMVWDMSGDPATICENFHDTRAAMDLLGLYHFTFRDVQIVLFPGGGLTDGEREEIGAYAAARPHEDNAMTGALAGKNLILVQLEAIDTWMLEDYMPALKAVKDKSVVFSNHYTPAYITAGTFNTEFMVNTGLLPAASGTPVSVYTRNSFPSSLAHLFKDKGYSANSFHGSGAEVYDRGDIHANLGYTYHSGGDMGMENYMMDSQLSAAFGDMTAATPFFSFVITYSGHGPYGGTNPIYLAHADEAQARAKRTDGNYVYAVGHAMETDLFVAELMDYLEKNGLLENTAVAFYADHYNYYMLNDALNMDIKGVDNMDLLQHTDFFIYCQGLEPQTVDKYTSSLDVLPTLANLFGLDADYSLLPGDDAFGSGGGWVFFNDNTWVGTGEDMSAQIAQRRRIGSLLLGGDYWREE